jgi:hypothetical protein
MTNQKVLATITAKDSLMKKVIGTVTSVTNGYATIQTTEVMSRYSDTFKKHSMGITAKIENVEVV